MMRAPAGFVGAAIAGAVLGYAQEWLGASGGRDERPEVRTSRLYDPGE